MSAPPAWTAARVAVVPVRAGRLPAGADETVAECDGDAIVVGEGVRAAAESLVVAVRRLRLAEIGAYRPAAWAAALAPAVAEARLVVLPASPDGRDLAARLAAATGRPLWARAVEVRDTSVVVVRHGDRQLVEAAVDLPAVATLLPGVAGVRPRPAGTTLPDGEPLPLRPRPARDPAVVEVVAPTPATADLAEARRVFAGGAGLQGAASFRLLEAVATAAGASAGATRVAVDLGWAEMSRQIGTTGVTTAPEVYVAFGVSGAVQHVLGIGSPDHVVSVNTDPACAMSAMADLAVVADAPSVLRELALRLGVGVPDESGDGCRD